MQPLNSPIKVQPWYHEPWPWLLMSGPAAVVVAGFVTLWLALASNDGLVADDYYKQGLAINQTLLRDETAAALGLRAEGTLNPADSRLRLVLAGRYPAENALRLRIAHPTRAGLDQTVVLNQVESGVFESRLPPLMAGRWLLTLENPERTWRLSGEWQVRQTNSFILEPGRK